MTVQPLYIGGREYLASSGQSFVSINPATGEQLAVVQSASSVDVDAAILSAAAGQKIWAAMSAFERGRILRKAVDILRQRNDELALLETKDTGKALSETCTVDVATGADVLEYYAGLGASLQGAQMPLREDSFFYTCREPLGVVAGIGAWNYPIQIALWKSAPALAAGNAMVFKPSEITPLSAHVLAKIYSEAGLPDGVFNVVQGDASIGEYLCRHPAIAKVSFTGSIPTGKKVMQAAATSLKELTLELGGKSPLIICPDADLSLAVDIAMMANFYSTGQVCTNGTRVFVPVTMQAEFEHLLLEKMHGIVVGDPEDPATNMGSLASFVQLEKVLSFIEQGKQAGARLLTGGSKAHLPGKLARGAFVLPTVFSDCRDEMSIVQEEIFGPVMSILSYVSEAEAIERANGTDYGLAAGVVSGSLTTAHRIIHQLQAGICWINTWGESPAPMPVGGYKQSGIGRENGLQTLYSYTQTKAVQVELGAFCSVFSPRAIDA